jgi:lactoylglutathione lyase
MVRARRVAMTVFSHFGICVSDLDRAVAFWTDGLGFALAERHEIGTEFAALMELEDVSVTSQFLRKDQMAIELLAFATPPATREPRRPIPTLGLTHVSLRVDDLDAVLGRLLALGGEEITGTRTEIAMGSATLRFVYLTDPDGTRVELMEIPG